MRRNGSSIGDRDDGQQREAVPAQLRRGGDGRPVEDRVKLVAGQQARHEVEQRQRGEQHRGARDGAAARVADLVRHQRADGHDEALHTQADPVGARKHGRADRTRRPAHQPRRCLSKPSADGDRDVDHHVEPQNLQRVQRSPAGDVQDPGADKDAM
jgi:hypothetical protein